MSFLDFIENIQKKPEKERYKILFASVFSIMAVVIILWLSIVFVSSFGEKTKNISYTSPFSIIKDTFSSIYEAIR